MTKSERLEKQYRELSINLIDVAMFLDKTKSKKYTPIICKIFHESFEEMKNDSLEERLTHLRKNFEDLKLSTDGLSFIQLVLYKIFFDSIDSSVYETINDLVEYGERGLLKTKDILQYKSIEEIKSDITFASLIDSEKNYKNQIIKEFENETWLALRPLTYQSSLKYGASTKWCTTSRYEKEYFARYWDRGILVYFINKKTGYKFAGYKGIKNSDELSFWNDLDSRIDSLDIRCDSYLYDVIKNIFKSNKSNSDLCDYDFKSKVAKDCKYILYDEDLIAVEKTIPTDIQEVILRDVNVGQLINLQNTQNITDTTYMDGSAYETPTMAS